MTVKLSIRVCTESGENVLVAEASPREALDLMRHAIADSANQSVWAEGKRLDGTNRIVFLAELEEMYQL